MAGIKPLLDMTEEQFTEVMRLLTCHVPNIEVWAYGSRATFKARPQSDLDMVVFLTKEQRECVSPLREALEESFLPFRVDLFIWDDIPDYFKQNILSERVVLQKKHTSPTMSVPRTATPPATSIWPK